jgi:hypothetical protein
MVRFPAGAGIFSLHHCVLNGSGAHPASYPVCTRCSFRGGKAAELEADCWPPSSAEVKECLQLPPLLQYVFLAWCSDKKTQGQLYLTLLILKHGLPQWEKNTQCKNYFFSFSSVSYVYRYCAVLKFDTTHTHTHTHTLGPFDRSVDWRQCAAVLLKEAVIVKPSCSSGVIFIPLTVVKSLSYGRFKWTLFRMAKQLRGPFEKFVDWRQCTAVMHNSTLPSVHELSKRPSYI